MMPATGIKRLQVEPSVFRDSIGSNNGQSHLNKLVYCEALPSMDRSAEIALFLAIEEAKRFSREVVGTEHILIGIIMEHRSEAAAFLRGKGLSLKNVRQVVRDLFGDGCELDSGVCTLSPKLKGLLAEANRIANDNGRDSVSASDLLGAFACDESAGRLVLHHLGVEQFII